MRAIAYIASDNSDKEKYLKDLQFQKNSIEYFCLKNKINLGDVFTENNFSNPDFKPTLLKIIKNINRFSDCLVVLNKKIISEDINFVEWVEYELKKLNVEMLYANANEKMSVHPLINSKEHANNLIKKIKTIPSLPVLVTKMLELIQDENSSLNDLAKLISYDAGLSFKVLRLVNSSYYGFEKQITTINNAIAILGLTTIKGLILSASVFKTLSTEGTSDDLFEYEKLWKHNLLTAFGSKLLNKSIKSNEDLFAGAVLHDIGKFVLAKLDTERFSKVWQLNYSNFNFQNRLEIERKYCGISHDEIGGLLVEKWELPELISDIIKFHHTPQKSKSHGFSCCIINFADILANLVTEKEPLNIDLFDEILLETYGISQSHLYSVYEKMNLEYENIDDIKYFFK